MRRLLLFIFQIIVFLNLPMQFLNAQVNKGWTANFPGVGIYSSARMADLNQDDVKDIIIGCGKLEFEKTDSAVIAIDGANGKMLWRVGARDQIFGSASLLDINHDSTVDILIGGRSAELMAINGRSGEILWEYFASGDTVKASDSSLYNFFNPQIIPDQDLDGLPDILISNGGDVNAEPHDQNRPPGKLMVISARSGKALAEVFMPDGKETYMSVVVTKIHENDKDLTVIFGTGGETISGNLYRTSLKNVMNRDISGATILVKGKEKGFIAPPVACDVNQDGYKDIVVNAVEGRIMAIDGKNNEVIWEKIISNTEAYGSLAVGYFNQDSIPDFFSSYAKGIWPNLEEANQFMFNGANGTVEFMDTLGLVQTSTPVVADFNGDGFDDGLMSINFAGVEHYMFKKYYNMLVIYDFHNRSTYQLTDFFPGVNLASTPWLGDLDNDGYLDVIYAYLTETRDVLAMNGFRISRISTNIKIKKPVKWGAYMGSDYDGVFEK